MSRYFNWVRCRAAEIVLFVMLCFWSLAWDYQQIGEYQRVGRVKVFLLAAAAVAALKIGKAWHWTVGLFYLYLIASYLHFGFHIGGVLGIFTITATLFLVPEIWNLITLEAFENTVLGAGLVHCAVGAVNMRGIYPFIPLTLKPEEPLPIGLLGQPTLLGPFLAFAFAIAAKRILDGRRVHYCALAFVFMIFALLTKSSMTAGCLAVVVVLLCLFYSGLRAGAVAVVWLLIAGYWRARHDSNFAWHSGRTEPWADAWHLSKINPWFGQGFGSWSLVGRGIAVVRQKNMPWTYVHSEPIQGVFELGRLGMGIVAAALLAAAGQIHFLYLFRDRSKLTYLLGLAVFGVDSLANFNLHITPHGQIFALCLFGILRQTPIQSPPPKRP